MKKQMDIAIIGSFLTVLIFGLGGLVWAIIAEVIDFIRDSHTQPSKQKYRVITINGKKQKVPVEHTSDGMVCITTETINI